MSQKTFLQQKFARKIIVLLLAIYRGILMATVASPILLTGIIMTQPLEGQADGPLAH